MKRTWTPSQEAAMSIRNKTLLVSAAAGSGKTSVLTERIIRTLTDPESPCDLSRILVVTFTRAAAKELKSRIAEALTQALAENPESDHLSRQLFLLGSAQISTIDSFFQKAVRANFDQLSLPATFRIADESEILPISMEVLDGLIEEYYQRYTPSESDNSSPFLRLEGNPFAEAMDHLVSNRSDGKLNFLLLDFAKEFESDPRGLESLMQCAEELRDGAEKEYFESRFGASLEKHLQQTFEGFSLFLKETEDYLDTAPDMREACLGIVQMDSQFCSRALEALKENRYERAREVILSFVNGRFPTVKDKTSPIIAYQEWRNKFKETVTKKLQPMVNFSKEAIREQMLRTAQLCHILYAFFTEYQSRLMDEKRQRGILEHNDIRAMLYRLLTDKDGNASDFARSLSSQYDAVYIDEYQDVDLLQDRIFSLVGENRRFMVGDIKQSIYGFRGSEPAIFAAYRRSMPLYTEAEAENADGNCVFMSDNFRCNEPVIRFANQICSFLFSACEESVGYRPQDDLVYSKKPVEGVFPVPVELAVFGSTPKGEASENVEKAKEEAVWVAAKIAELLKGEVLDSGEKIAPSDIAILVRNRSQGDAYAKELKKLNIPVAASTAAGILQDPLLSDVLNLLRAVDNPYRDLPLSEFLLSSLGGFSLEELNVIRESADMGISLFDALEAYTTKNEADPLAQKAKESLEWILEMQRISSVLPADRFLRRLYREERLISYASTPVLLFLYEQARVYQRSSYCGLYGFLSHFSKLLERGKISADGFCKAEKAVTVMTMHHSKGLEFPVVFLCSCGSAFNKDDGKKTLLYHHSLGCATKLYNRITGNTDETALRLALRQHIDSEQAEESIRTLYVALTRARERLFVTGTLPGKYETAISSASLIKRGNRAAILGASGFLSWILAAMQEKEANAADFPCVTHHFPYGTVQQGEPLASIPESDGEAPAVSEATRHYAKICKAHEETAYELAFLQGLPTKVAASKLGASLLDELLDEADADAINEKSLAMMETAPPPFERLLKEDTAVSATDIGTATHAFLEFCDFQALKDRTVEEECARLVKEDFLLEESARIISKEQLSQFRQSDLFAQIQKAKTVYREQKFGIFLPMEHLTARKELAGMLSGHSIFVQGSIDLLLLMPDGRMLLVDYKTDRLSQTERQNPLMLADKMLKAHGDQLAAYAVAIHEMFGRFPDEMHVYSLPLGRLVPLANEEILKKAKKLQKSY